MEFFNAWDICVGRPALELFHDLETTVYYVDESSESSCRLARCIIEDILKWADRMKCHLELTCEVGALYVLWFHFSDTTS